MIRSMSMNRIIEDLSEMLAALSVANCKKLPCRRLEKEQKVSYSRRAKGHVIEVKCPRIHTISSWVPEL